MPIDSASASHASCTQAILPPSAERPSEAARHKVLANAVGHVRGTQTISPPSAERPSETARHTAFTDDFLHELLMSRHLAAGVLGYHRGNIPIDILSESISRNISSRPCDSKRLFSLHEILSETLISEETVQCYASLKSPKDWQIDWNNLALEKYNPASLEFMLRVKAVMDRQTPHQAHQMNINGCHEMKGPHFMHLMRASMYGDVYGIDLLLNNGADPYKRAFGWNAFLLAADKGHTHAVRRLLQASGDLLNIRTNFGMSALMLAVITPHIETIRLLLDNGIDANCSNQDGKTALIIAVENNNIDAIALLLPVTRDSLNAVTKSGDTALITATRLAHTDAVRLLLNNGGIDTEIKNAAGDTALMIAKRNKHKEIVSLLPPPPPVQGGIIYQLFSRSRLI